MPYVLALDQGTTSCRAILFGDDGRVTAVAQQEFPQHFPHPGWVEHDPEEIWQTQLEVAEAAISSAKLQPSDVSAIGITNQRETTVVWERRSARPIYRAIVWQDRRTASICDQLKEIGTATSIQQRTGLIVDPYFSATKLAWILDQVPQAREQAERGELAFGTIDSWLAYRLTAGTQHVTDVSNASRTMLFNIHTGQWDDQLLQQFRIPVEILPKVVSSSGVIARCATTLPLADIPLASMIGDQQAALFGQACYLPGQTKNTYGTGCFTLMHTGKRPIESQHRLLTTVAWKIGESLEYALEGSVFIGGAVVQWLRDGLGIIRSASEIESLANTVPDSGGVYFVPAFAGLGAPHWDPHARGIISGITRGTTAGHIARAALEGIAFQVADLLSAMERDARQTLVDLRVDGGAANNDTLLQLQADLLQRPVVRAAETETTALGAAYLAGLATHVWKSPADIGRQWRAGKSFAPRIALDEATRRRCEWDVAVQKARGT